MKPLRGRGFSILELTVGLFVLTLLSVMAFSIFAWSTSMFQLTSVRLELQGEIRRINGALRRDILGSCYTSLINNPVNITGQVNPPDPSPTVSLRRDGICFSAITDIQDPNSYDTVTGLCKFDCSTVYSPYTTPGDVNECKLYRYRIQPHADVPDSTPSVSQLPFAPFYGSTTYMWPNPNAMIPGSVRCYTNRIRTFEILPNLGDQTLEVKISLQGPVGRASTAQKRTTEIVESSILLKAENTWPKL